MRKKNRCMDYGNRRADLHIRKSHVTCAKPNRYTPRAGNAVHLVFATLLKGDLGGAKSFSFR